jgi:hypothetical protein
MEFLQRVNRSPKGCVLLAFRRFANGGRFSPFVVRLELGIEEIKVCTHVSAPFVLSADVAVIAHRATMGSDGVTAVRY